MGWACRSDEMRRDACVGVVDESMLELRFSKAVKMVPCCVSWRRTFPEDVKYHFVFNVAIFWDIAPCSMYVHLHLQGRI
jgi:hypothetical protein